MFFLRRTPRSPSFICARVGQKLTLVSPSGKEGTLSLLTQGDFAGEEALTSNVELHIANGALLPTITQETLAEIIGTTRSRVNFFMNRFRKLGFIEYKGRIRVNRTKLNLVLHD